MLRRDVVRRIVLIAVLITAVVLIFYGTWQFYRWNPVANSLCVVCHVEAPFYESFVLSPHRELNCQYCHDVDMARYIYSYLFVGKSSSEIARQTLPLYTQCIKCHSTSSLEDLQIHEIHLGLAKSANTCTMCHADHRLTPTSENCMNCHKPQVVFEDHLLFHERAELELQKGRIICNECHSSLSPWAKPLSPSTITGVVQGKSCFECHGTPAPVDITGRSCLDCHKA